MVFAIAVCLIIQPAALIAQDGTLTKTLTSVFCGYD
jgi:hypothetical protein